MIGYQHLWTEQKLKLDKAIRELEKKRKETPIAVERERYNHKLNGIKLAYGYMMDAEKQYGICPTNHENEMSIGDRRMYCPDCNKEYFDASI